MSQENSDLITLTNTILGYGLVTEIIFLLFFFFSRMVNINNKLIIALNVEMWFKSGP